jgi:predicted Zn-dependent peptidase
VSRPLLAALVLLLLAGTVSAKGQLLPDYERVDLENGTVLLLSEKHDVPLIGLRAVIRSGAVADPADKNGLASLLAGMLEKGAGSRDAAEFAEAVSAVGGELFSSADLETITIGAEFLSSDGELMLELVSDMLRRPMLAEEEFNKLRDRSINLIKSAKNSNPGQLLPTYGTAFLFGEHPYGNPVGGSEATLAAIDYEDMVSFYNTHLGGDRLIISVVGDFNAVAMKDRLVKRFGDWPAAAEPPPEVPALSRAGGRRVLLVDVPETTQTYFWIGNVAVPMSYPRRAELDLANTVFGGRFTSMLNTILRVESGLTYGAWSALQRLSNSGYIVISSFTETSNTMKAIDMALETQERLRKSGLNDEQIKSARNYIMGQFPPLLETASQQARQLAMLEQFGLDKTYINDYPAALAAVSGDGIESAIEEVYAAPSDLVFILIGDAGAIRDAISDYGPLTEVSITDPRFRH